jgi:hypothetical protein
LAIEIEDRDVMSDRVVFQTAGSVRQVFYLASLFLNNETLRLNCLSIIDAVIKV